MAPFLDGVQLCQGCRATIKSVYFLLCRFQTILELRVNLEATQAVVLNLEILGLKSSTLTTKPLLYYPTFLLTPLPETDITRKSTYNYPTS